VVETISKFDVNETTAHLASIIPLLLCLRLIYI